MRISAKSEYAVQACAELARLDASSDPMTTEALAATQGLPETFLAQILTSLRRAGLVASSRGRAGGYRLARPAGEITVADIVRVVDGPLVTIRDERPTDVAYVGASESLLTVWVALRVAVRDVLDGVTVADLATDRLPPHIYTLAQRVDAWHNP